MDRVGVEGVAETPTICSRFKQFILKIDPAGGINQSPWQQQSDPSTTDKKRRHSPWWTSSFLDLHTYFNKCVGGFASLQLCVRWINLINRFGRGFLFCCFETSGHGALHILVFELGFVFQAHLRFESFAFYYPLPLSQSIRVTFCLDSGWLTSRYLTALTNEVDGHLTGRLRKVLSVVYAKNTTSIVWLIYQVLDGVWWW